MARTTKTIATLPELKKRLVKLTYDSLEYAECFCGFSDEDMCWMHKLLAGYSKLLNSTHGLTLSMLKIIDEATKEVQNG